MGIATLTDPARFARALRRLARDAHQARSLPPSATARRRISRRIGLLASALGDRGEGPIGAWLDNLGREVGSSAPRPARPRRILCGCA